jgi:hypothetical protein
MPFHQFQTPSVTPIEGPRGPDPDVTLRLSAGDARRIIRALEQTSLSLCGSPSGSRLASSYSRLANSVRRQACAD